MAAQQSECTYCHWTLQLKVVKKVKAQDKLTLLNGEGAPDLKGNQKE